MSVAQDIDVVLQANAVLGEGPLWDPGRGELIWLDIEPGTVHRYDPATGADGVKEAGGRVGFAVLRAFGGLVVGVEHSFVAIGEQGAVEQIAVVEPQAPTRFNDGNCDARGRLYAGTMALDESSPVGSLYRLDPDGSVERLLADVTVSNGLDWSPTDDTLYYVDSAIGVDKFDFDVETGRLSERRPFIRLKDPGVVPDGLAVDVEGFIWVALWGGWAVRRYTPDGELEREIKLPTAQITSCAFGGHELDELYITSARVGLSDGDLARQLHAGSLFCHRPGVVGRAQNPFRG